jgi:Membrane bound beta barrel domain (DUF5777)
VDQERREQQLKECSVIRQLSFAVLIVLAGARAGFAQPSDGREPAPAVERTPAADTAPDTGKDAEKKKDPKDKDAKDKDAKDKDAGAKDAAAGTATTEVQERDDAVLDRAQPDFMIVNLPTSLRLPKYKSAFRVTHRFTRALGQGDFGDLLEDFFGFDSGALIGLEYRFAPMAGAQVGILRTSDRTIEFFGQYSVKTQSESFPFGLAANVSIDGTNNFRDSYSPALGAVVSRTIGTHAALYVEPIWVNNSNPLPSELGDDNDTFLLGVGARVRVHGGTYVVFEVVPRVAGYDPGSNAISFGLEKRAGGHSFQINFSNSFGTTMGQIARGGLNNDDWYIGFNISRKFF